MQTSQSPDSFGRTGSIREPSNENLVIAKRKPRKLHANPDIDLHTRNRRRARSLHVLYAIFQMCIPFPARSLHDDVPLPGYYTSSQPTFRTPSIIHDQKVHVPLGIVIARHGSARLIFTSFRVSTTVSPLLHVSTMSESLFRHVPRSRIATSCSFAKDPSPFHLNPRRTSDFKRGDVAETRSNH